MIKYITKLYKYNIKSPLTERSHDFIQLTGKRRVVIGVRAHGDHIVRGGRGDGGVIPNGRPRGHIHRQLETLSMQGVRKNTW